MPNEAVPVRWQLAKDERFRHVVRQGTAIARPEHGHTVHVELSHLQDDREYWYRFRVGPYVTAPLAPGPRRTRTAGAASSR